MPMSSPARALDIQELRFALALVIVSVFIK
jgi:hypothetical protein